MPHALVNNRVHVIFSTKGRQKLIPDDNQPRLWAFTTVASLPSDESLGYLQSPSRLCSELMEDETIRVHPR